MLSHHEEGKNCGAVVARLPFLGGMSMQLQKELCALVEKQTWNQYAMNCKTPPGTSETTFV